MVWGLHAEPVVRAVVIDLDACHRARVAVSKRKQFFFALTRYLWPGNLQVRGNSGN